MDDFIDKMNDYCEYHSSVLDPVLSKIERETHLRTLKPRMLSGHLQGTLLAIISKIKAPQNILEIGTFTGYSAICLAQGLAPGGKIITIEYDEENVELAAEFIENSDYSDRIILLHGDAKTIIPDMDIEFDLVFIDADKEAYIHYFDLIIDKCRSGAVILADNVLWSGKVLNEHMDKKTKLLDAFNKKVLEDPRVENVILPIRDGINVIRKI